MIRALGLIFVVLPAMAQTDVLICEFTPLHFSECEEFTINTHHGADTPQFEYRGTTASIQVIPEGSAAAQSYVTLGHADREIITVFNGFDAIQTRHYTDNDTPTAQTATGRCTSFY